MESKVASERTDYLYSLFPQITASCDPGDFLCLDPFFYKTLRTFGVSQ